MVGPGSRPAAVADSAAAVGREPAAGVAYSAVVERRSAAVADSAAAVGSEPAAGVTYSATVERRSAAVAV